ncbi:MAG TPA: recombinase family protein [Steroidobacteraceae bacterium]|nr:recombinase family protein [Steroidobacteraceae bacterium]
MLSLHLPQQKIARSHLGRLAIVYLRQSSARQVRENFRSTERQYSLAEDAVKLGWPPEQVVTVDQDLGISGRFSDGRARGAFKELVARVCLGEVGAIFGLEVSRLARSSAETQRLLEYCGLTDTLVIDTDGICDLRDFNDQLILGVKGQLAQAELHVMAVRMHGARRHAAERGELRIPLAVGYLYDEDGDWIIDPDEEVHAAVADLFTAFTQAGSAFGAVGIFAGRRFPTRLFGGARAGELRWGALTYARAKSILQNPCYAGAYVAGRYQARRVVAPDGAITTKRIRLPRSDWVVVIHDHHPAYISWETYLAIERRLEANATGKGRRPPREGQALCQGIAHCGSCGRGMTTTYTATGGHYVCSRSRQGHFRTPACRSIKAAGVDELVARRLLAALAPEEIALALSAADEFQDRRARANRALDLRVERARYDAIRAERAFHACEPDNRLVARSLENRWEEKLRELKDAEAQLAEHIVPSSEPSREQLEALARDLPALWAAKTTAQRDRKRLLRSLIADVTLTSHPEKPTVQIGIRWQSGAAEQHTITRPQTAGEAHSTPPEALELIRRLGPHRSNAEIATELQASGLRTGTGMMFDERIVCGLRCRYRVPAASALRNDELTVSQVAERLGISKTAIYHWIADGTLPARRGYHNQLCIPFPPEVEQQFRERVRNSARLRPKRKSRRKEEAV